jgi:hypothetical protein
MNAPPNLDSTEAPRKNASLLNSVLSKAPVREWFQFGIFLFVQVLQWKSLIMMSETEGQHGAGNFITTMMISTSIGISIKELSDAYKIVFFLSSLAMCMYNFAYGW